MRTRNVFLVALVVMAGILIAGCASEEKYNNLELRNRSQQERINELESQYNVAKLQLAQAREQLASAEGLCQADTEELRKKVAVLEQDVEKKAVLINKMQAELVRGGVALPPELSSQLEEFAAGSEMVSFDSSNGMVKFESDLLFEKGSDRVTASAAKAIEALCKIINSAEAAKFDIIIAGYTDDVPILKASTKQQHPNNWYLSAHRAIAVEKIMESNGVQPKRMSVRGFGEYRPIEPNKAGKQGNPRNRRVEIYIVPAG
ncbi:MAG: OmpA family protein, partial [Planctomycetes bacterium]|nr:OmpA family protein [Planctomycetota bacterium]